MSTSPCRAVVRGVRGVYSLKLNLIWPISTDFLERKLAHRMGLVQGPTHPKAEPRHGRVNRHFYPKVPKRTLK